MIENQNHLENTTITILVYIFQEFLLCFYLSIYNIPTPAVAGFRHMISFNPH